MSDYFQRDAEGYGVPEPNLDRFDDPELNRDWDNEDDEHIFDSPEADEYDEED